MEEIHLPKVYDDLSTSQMLVMERLEGVSVGQAGSIETLGLDGEKLAMLMLRAEMKPMFGCVISISNSLTQLRISILLGLVLSALTLEYAKAGAPDSSRFRTLATLFFDVGQRGYDVHLWFFALGGILWYYLFYRTKYIPRLLSIENGDSSTPLHYPSATPRTGRSVPLGMTNI